MVQNFCMNQNLLLFGYLNLCWEPSLKLKLIFPVLGPNGSWLQCPHLRETPFWHLNQGKSPSDFNKIRIDSVIGPNWLGKTQNTSALVFHEKNEFRSLEGICEHGGRKMLFWKANPNGKEMDFIVVVPCITHYLTNPRTKPIKHGTSNYLPSSGHAAGNEKPWYAQSASKCPTDISYIS